MKYSIYKPNSKNSGAAFSFEIGNLKEGSVGFFISAVQQSGWNDKTKTGSFKDNAKDPNKSTTVKMSPHEMGEFLSSFSSRIPYTAFHKNNDDNTVISLTPWDKERKIKGKDGEKTYQSPAFGLSISKNSSSQFKIGIEAGEVEVLKVIINEFISQVLQAEKDAYKKSLQEQGSGNSEKNSGKQQESAKEDDEDEDDDVPF